MSIFKLKPACKDYIWGGNRLITEYAKEYSGLRLAETWELSCHKDGLSVIDGGEFDGLSLKEYADRFGAAAIGSVPASFSEFPVLIKFIDAKENLSIQVHPDDEYARINENSLGKTEMWYVMDAEQDAAIYYGFNDKINSEEFSDRIKNNTLTDVLNKVLVEKGDCFFIPAGTVHAICRGCLIAEIQQSSNITYRVFDYGRLGTDGKPRELNIDKAMDVAVLEPVKAAWDFGNHLVTCRYFTTDFYDGEFSMDADERSFVSVLVLNGDGCISCASESLVLKKGDSIFVSANSGEFKLSGNLSVLCTRVI